MKEESLDKLEKLADLICENIKKMNTERHPIDKLNRDVWMLIARKYNAKNCSSKDSILNQLTVRDLQHLLYNIIDHSDEVHYPESWLFDLIESLE